MADAFLAASRPNVVFFLVDDWPYELWPSSSRADENYTALLPHISQHFAQDGLGLVHAYSHKISNPARRALLSGRFTFTLGGQGALPAKISTLGDRMKAAGYYTAFRTPLPNTQGTCTCYTYQ